MKMECFRAIRLKLRLTWQIWNKGWCDAESWDFSKSVAPKVLSRLKVYKEQHNCSFVRKDMPTSHTKEETEAILDKMIYSFDCLCAKEEADENVVMDREWFQKNKEKSEKIQEGLELFGKYFMELWWQKGKKNGIQ